MARWCTNLVRRSGNISVHVIAGDQLPGGALPKKTVDTADQTGAYDPRPYALALVAVAIALGCGELVNDWIGVENVDLVFLTAIVGIAVRFGLWPSLFASVASALCYNFFFLPPIYTLHDRRSAQHRGLRAVHASSPSSSPMSRRAAACRR